MEEISFRNRVVVITGAGSGLGREYALEFASRGALVVVNDLGSTVDGDGENRNAADSVVNEIKALGGTAVANYDSVSTAEGGENIINTAVKNFGRLDVLVNNAGIIRDTSLVKMDESDWDRVSEVHLKGAFCVTKPAVKIMKEQNYGRIIFTTSTSGLFGNFGQCNYGAAKLGIVGFMNSLKLELSKYDIKINAVAPNAYSRMTEHIIPKEMEKQLQAKFNVPMVVYLCSQENNENGSVFVSAAGWFGKAALVCGKGVCIGDAQRDIKAEEIKEKISEITSLEGGKPLDNLLEIFQFVSPLL
ncbi:MAG: SDR family oxidoreductase [Desulfobacteraceae bacterium]|nr:SDR family oxidoreductase [Desulfobacteraceae bacterium]